MIPASPSGKGMWMVDGNHAAWNTAQTANARDEASRFTRMVGVLVLILRYALIELSFQGCTIVP